jgi:hypothetical protein
MLLTAPLVYLTGAFVQPGGRREATQRHSYAAHVSAGFMPSSPRECDTLRVPGFDGAAAGRGAVAGVIAEVTAA